MVRRTTSRRRQISQSSGSPQAAIDYSSTTVGPLELSEKKWVLAVQLPGVERYSRHVLDAFVEKLLSFVERLKARCASAGRMSGVTQVTAKGRYARALATVSDWRRRNRHRSLRDQHAHLSQMMMRGH